MSFGRVANFLASLAELLRLAFAHVITIAGSNVRPNFTPFRSIMSTNSDVVSVALTCASRWRSLVKSAITLI